MDYLRASLTEATEGTTDITGGLVLSKFIGVKGGGTQVVAGLPAPYDTERLSEVASRRQELRNRINELEEYLT